MNINIKQYQYYVIIGVVSVIALLFLPMIGSEAGLAWNIPNTITGWCVYITSKLIIASINILIFHCFNMQGRVNVKDDEKYNIALQIMCDSHESDDYNPISPEEWTRRVYGRKSITVFSTSVLSAVGLTQAVLTFDWMSMLTYLFTITMGIIFGILQMNAAEEYWTDEFYRYAIKLIKEKENND